MAFFGLFKKKDDFDSLLKDPLSDPFGKPSDMSIQTNPFQNNQPSQELPPFDMPGMPKNETALESSYQNGQNNYNTSANPFPQMQNQSPSFESTYPQRKNKGPEVFEEMPLPSYQGAQRQAEQSVDRRDFEILNSKLDTIKSQLENLNHRLDNFEKKPLEEEQPRPRRYNW